MPRPQGTGRLPRLGLRGVKVLGHRHLRRVLLDLAQLSGSTGQRAKTSHQRHDGERAVPVAMPSSAISQAVTRN